MHEKATDLSYNTYVSGQECSAIILDHKYVDRCNSGYASVCAGEVEILDRTYKRLTEKMSMRPSFFRMLMLRLQKM